ncbi:MAG: sulfite exporter TauE/SafE family protein [Opitutales bacterium]|nr:sulfite exporter TauE/SafE family protein [Opitutales bacterium]
MIFTETLLVGLGAGGGCLAHCGPALLPVLLCGRERRWQLALTFMGARLVTYLLVAMLIQTLGKASGLGKALESPLLGGSVYLLLALMLARYCYGLSRGCKEGKCHNGNGRERFSRFRLGAFSYASRAGILSATGLCAPMLAFAVEALRVENSAQAALAVTGFFIGTSVALIPLFALGAICKTEAAMQAGQVFCALASAMYVFQGLGLLLKGL